MSRATTDFPCALKAREMLRLPANMSMQSKGVAGGRNASRDLTCTVLVMRTHVKVQITQQCSFAIR